MRGLPAYRLPDLKSCIERNIEAAQLTNPAVRCAGLSINTGAMEAGAAEDYLRTTGEQLGLPCVDPVRTGVARLVDNLSG